MPTRRELIANASALAAATAALAQASRAEAAPLTGRSWDASYSGGRPDAPALAPSEPGKDYSPTSTPNGATLPFKVVDGVKVFHLVAEELWHEFAAGLKAQCWGYNGRVHGPTLEASEGDRVRVYVTNKLKAATTVHWHGVFLPNGMDGVGGLTQRAIKPGETFKYEWTFRQHGTYMYHSHHDEMTQMALGLMGMIVVHPRQPPASYRVDRDFALLLGEWRIRPGTSRPDPNEMTDFNVLTMNAKVFPATAPLVCKRGERIRIRLGNLSAMDHHPIHLHGHSFKLVETDGGQIPPSAQWPEASVLVPAGSTRTIEFIADAPGDWPLHCHMTHHVMNQMGHGIPNTLGADLSGSDARIRALVPGYMSMGETGMGDMADMAMRVPENSIPMLGGRGPYDAITMGGMFTILKVRETLANYADPGWYTMPKGSQADLASAQEMARDGIKV